MELPAEHCAGGGPGRIQGLGGSRCRHDVPISHRAIGMRNAREVLPIGDPEAARSAAPPVLGILKRRLPGIRR
jgi:hypothetical protein